MKLHLEILPRAQKEYWDGLAGEVPLHFVLYGGTAVALRFGHRSSVDFDYFTDQSIGYDSLAKTLPGLAQATVLQRAPDTVVVSMPMPSGEVKLSFFGGLSFGRIGDPERLNSKVTIAAPIDLLATKLKTLHDRIEPKDYLDIEVLLKSGLTLNQGVGAARALYGNSLNPLDTAKAVGWFKDGGLDSKLPAGTKSFLAAASAKFDPKVVAPPIKSKSLAPTRQRKSDNPER